MSAVCVGPAVHEHDALLFAMEKAIADGAEDIIRQLVEDGFDLSVRTASGDSLLMVALRRNLVPIPLLLALGAPVTRTGYNELHLAASCARGAAIRPLVGAGADLNARDDSGRTPLDCAMSEDFMATATELVMCGAGVEEANSVGERPIHAALRLFDQFPGMHRVAALGLIDELLAAGADIDTPDLAGNVPRDMLLARPALAQRPILHVRLARQEALAVLYSAITTEDSNETESSGT